LQVIVLISGEGTNLQTLIDAAQLEGAGFAVVAVFSDRGDARGLDRARQSGIAAHHIDPRKYPSREDFDEALADAIASYSPGLIVLAGFMRILSPGFVARFADRMLNIHPSLLPKLKGLHTHRRALAAAEVEHGASVHFVTAELDGGPIVVQYRIRIRDSDTEDSLSARVHEGEYIILPLAVGWFAAGRLRLESGRAILDGEALSTPVCVNGERA
jgi:phosphoribosylglycinamide formyltransferase-1